MATLIDLSSSLRDVRRGRGMTQSALAAKAGIPMRSYQRLEAADPGVRVSTLLRALAALGLAITVGPAEGS